MMYKAETSATHFSQRERLSPLARALYPRLITRSSKALILAFVVSLSTALFAFGQDNQPEKSRAAEVQSRRAGNATTDSQKVETALGILCAERSRDPLASVPIDEMQARPSLELNHPEAVVGA